MVRLIPRSAADGLVPVQIGGLTLSEQAPDAITLVAPFKGQDNAVSAALKSGIGAAWPAPGRATGKAGARVIWSGLGQALVLGPPVTVTGAAITDQTDAWVAFVLEGKGATDVLARLTPLDLRDSQFKRGHAARSLLGHMNCLFLRAGVMRFEMLVFRSMAVTAVHDLTRAMQSVTAQSGR